MEHLLNEEVKRLENCKGRIVGFDFEFLDAEIEKLVTILVIDIATKHKYIIDLTKNYIIDNRKYLIKLFENFFKNNTIYEASEKETITKLTPNQILGSGYPNKLEYILKFADLKSYYSEYNKTYGIFRYVNNMFSSSKNNEVEKFKHNYTYLANSIDIINSKVKDLKLIGYLGSNGNLLHNVNKNENHYQYCINNLECFSNFFNLAFNEPKAKIPSPHLNIIYCRFYNKNYPNTIFFRNSKGRFQQNYYNTKEYNPTYYSIDFHSIKNIKVKQHLLKCGNLPIIDNNNYEPNFNIQFLSMVNKLDLTIEEFNNINQLI